MGLLTVPTAPHSRVSSTSGTTSEDLRLAIGTSIKRQSALTAA